MSQAPPQEQSETKPEKTLKPWEEPAYSIRCVCGTQVAGERINAPQQVECPKCDRALFILPINVYPLPKKPRKKKKRKKRDVPLSVVFRQNLESTASAMGATLEYLAILLVRKLKSALRAFIRWWSPLRIAIASLLVIVAVAGTFGFRQHQISQANLTLRESVKLAEEAFEDQRLGDAAVEYEKAARSVNILKRDDRFAREIRQKSQELTALVNANTIPLNEMLIQANQMFLKSSEESWQTRFETLCRGRWLIMETWMVTSPHPETGRLYCSLQHPLHIDDLSLDIMIPESSSVEFPPEGEARRVLLAGQLDGFPRASLDGKQWQVILKSDSTFLWCNEETATLLGFELSSPWQAEQPLTQVLKQQREFTLGPES